MVVQLILGADTELSIAGRKRTQNTFVAFVVRRSTPTLMKVADNEQATMSVLRKSPHVRALFVPASEPQSKP
jgi:hypothetical protein